MFKTTAFLLLVACSGIANAAGNCGSYTTLETCESKSNKGVCWFNSNLGQCFTDSSIFPNENSPFYRNRKTLRIQAYGHETRNEVLSTATTTLSTVTDDTSSTRVLDTIKLNDKDEAAERSPTELPQGPAFCQLPPVTGVCKAYFSRWYWDKEKKLCLPLMFGGCGGNSNNFELLEDCEAAAAEWCI